MLGMVIRRVDLRTDAAAIVTTLEQVPSTPVAARPAGASSTCPSALGLPVGPTVTRAVLGVYAVARLILLFPILVSVNTIPWVHTLILGLSLPPMAYITVISSH